MALSIPRVLEEKPLDKIARVGARCVRNVSAYIKGDTLQGGYMSSENSTQKDGGQKGGGRKAGRGFMLAALVFFLIFAGNIIIGKVSVVMGATNAVGFGDVAEFLILFAAVAMFIGACLARERAEKKTSA